MSISNDVKQQLVNILKDSAVDILNNAEEYVGDVPYLCGITVTIDRKIDWIIKMNNILKRLFHDILGWHTPTYIYSTNGVSIKSRCRICGKEILQDSQGNWFTF